MTDINETFQRELRTRRARNIFAPAEKTSTRQDTGAGVKAAHISVDEGTLLNDEHGPQQVQSLLHYVLEPYLEKQMADAEDDFDAVRHLNRLKRGK